MKNILTQIEQRGTKYEDSLTQQYKKETGIYYTNQSLSNDLITEFFTRNLVNKNNIKNLHFLEPCVGNGSFVFSYLECALKLVDNMEDKENLIKSIYVGEIDKNALLNFVSNLTLYCKNYGIPFDSNQYLENNTSLHLLFSPISENFQYYSIENAFKGYHGKFDFIATNPPYKKLKAEKKDNSKLDYDMELSYYSQISLFVKKNFKLANNGVLNIYKLFVEEILLNYSTDSSLILLLIPATILSDISCSKLRNELFVKRKCHTINIYPEQNGMFDGTQTMCSLSIESGKPTTSINICKDWAMESEHHYFQINYKRSLESGRNSIPLLDENGFDKLANLSHFPKIKELIFINNKRGELDLTFYKSLIRNSGNVPLIRGRNVCPYFLDLTKDIMYVDASFLNNKSKKSISSYERICCQQVTNIKKKHRLYFAYVPKNYVLGNSCNYLTVEPNIYSIDIFYLLGILNSNILDWYFKIYSSNNHISNYEIGELPIPVENTILIQKISHLVCEYLKNKDENLKMEIDKMVCEQYGLTIDEKETKKIGVVQKQESFLDCFINDFSLITGKQLKTEEAESILNSQNLDSDFSIYMSLPKSYFILSATHSLVSKYQKIINNEVLNHTGFKLSTLDLELAKDVPQGGSWKDIPLEYAKKSKRVMGIRSTGGRTTLYGRIDYSKPSYTITTYFNRPGNGTYLHPTFNRVISSREAARFQSFPDDYYFCGSKKDQLLQIGNAVPPLLAKAIVEAIKKKTPINYSLDLFAGAGGLTKGIKEAGVKSVVGIDFFEKACETLKVNNPEINVICGDLTKQETKGEIYDAIKNVKIDLLAGGPPCQGFSLAGKRFVDDPRNKLFKEYVTILKYVMPKVFIMENVEGMASMLGGKVYLEIKKEFSECGYLVAGHFLMANDFGVPQKRKRLITIGVRNDLGINPDDLYPSSMNTNVTAKDAIFDLENIPCGDNAKYSFSGKQSKYVQQLRSFFKNRS